MGRARLPATMGQKAEASMNMVLMSTVRTMAMMTKGTRRREAGLRSWAAAPMPARICWAQSGMFVPSFRPVPTRWTTPASTMATMVKRGLMTAPRALRLLAASVMASASSVRKVFVTA